MQLEMPVLAVKILIYDVVLGTDTLTKLTQLLILKIINYCVRLLNNKNNNVQLGHISTDNESRAKYVRVTKPTTKVVHNTNKNNHNKSSYELTSEQRDKLNKLLNKHTATFDNNHSTTSL